MLDHYLVPDGVWSRNLIKRSQAARPADTYDLTRPYDCSDGHRVVNGIVYRPITFTDEKPGPIYIDFILVPVGSVNPSGPPLLHPA